MWLGITEFAITVQTYLAQIQWASVSFQKSSTSRYPSATPIFYKTLTLIWNVNDASYHFCGAIGFNWLPNQHHLSPSSLTAWLKGSLRKPSDPYQSNCHERRGLTYNILPLDNRECFFQPKIWTFVMSTSLVIFSRTRVSIQSLALQIRICLLWYVSN